MAAAPTRPPGGSYQKADEPTQELPHFYVLQGATVPGGQKWIEVWNPETSEWQQQPSERCEFPSAQAAYDAVKAHKELTGSIVVNRFAQPVDASGTLIVIQEVDGVCQLAKLHV